MHSHTQYSRCTARNAGVRDYPRASWQRARICQTRTDAGVIVPLGRRDRASQGLARRRGRKRTQILATPLPQRKSYSSPTSVPPTKHHTRREVSRGIETVPKQGCDPAPMHHAAHFIFVLPFFPLSPSLFLFFLTLLFSLSLFHKFLSSSTYLGPVTRQKVCHVALIREREKSLTSPSTTHHQTTSGNATIDDNDNFAMSTTEQRGYGYGSRCTPRVAA